MRRVLVVDDNPLVRQVLPDVVLKEAHKAAKALAKVVETSRKVVINGQIYLTYEHWQTETPTAEDDRCYDRAKGWTESTSHAALLWLPVRNPSCQPGSQMVQQCSRHKVFVQEESQNHHSAPPNRQNCRRR